MPSARELLEQADALMRRNRARAVDTEIPELTEMIALVAPAPAAPVALDDVPELTDAVEEIEIASIVELPDDFGESSAWLHHDHGDWSILGRGHDSIVAGLAMANTPARDAERPRSPLAIVGKPGAAADRIRDAMPAPPAAEATSLVAAAAPPSVLPELPPVPSGIAVSPSDTAVVAEAVAALLAHDTARPPHDAVVSDPSPAPGVPAAAVALPVVALPPAMAEDWARWEVLADEIRMQVLQRIDIFTDTRLRDQLSAQLQPIVDRASVEMVSTINQHVGGLLRAYIAEAIEREIEKWRGTAG